jgi:bifunctional N-acetylglucosamine-1-phosphate-uridyltransferase/glucosamine-1-phosphate-acetyltransferase GlmU-like protein
MKKVFALAFVAGMVTLASCGEKKSETATDSSTVVTSDSAVAAPDSTTGDSTVAAPDSTK